MKKAPLRHARGGGHPGFLMLLWIPAPRQRGDRLRGNDRWGPRENLCAAVPHFLSKATEEITDKPDRLVRATNLNQREPLFISHKKRVS